MSDDVFNEFRIGGAKLFGTLFGVFIKKTSRPISLAELEQNRQATLLRELDEEGERQKAAREAKKNSDAQDLQMETNLKMLQLMERVLAALNSRSAFDGSPCECCSALRGTLNDCED